MTSTELLMDGAKLMLIGMGAVFFFLVMLVGCISLMSRLVNRFFSKPVAAAVPRRPAAVVCSVDPQTMVAITEAVRLHRARRVA